MVHTSVPLYVCICLYPEYICYIPISSEFLCFSPYDVRLVAQANVQGGNRKQIEEINTKYVRGGDVIIKL